MTHALYKADRIATDLQNFCDKAKPHAATHLISQVTTSLLFWFPSFSLRWTKYLYPSGTHLLLPCVLSQFPERLDWEFISTQWRFPTNVLRSAVLCMKICVRRTLVSTGLTSLWNLPISRSWWSVLPVLTPSRRRTLSRHLILLWLGCRESLWCLANTLLRSALHTNPVHMCYPPRPITATSSWPGYFLCYTEENSAKGFPSTDPPQGLQ